MMFWRWYCYDKKDPDGIWWIYLMNPIAPFLTLAAVTICCKYAGYEASRLCNLIVDVAVFVNNASWGIAILSEKCPAKEFTMYLCLSTILTLVAV